MQKARDNSQLGPQFASMTENSAGIAQGTLTTWQVPDKNSLVKTMTGPFV